MRRRAPGRVGLLGAAALIGGLGGMAARPAAGQPAIRLTDPVEKVLVLRETQSFEAWEYAPPWELEVPASPDEASYASPESALAAWVGALLAADEAWIERAVTADRWRRRVARSAEERAQEGRFLATFYEDRRLVLAHRVEAQGVLLVELSNYDRESGDRLLTFLYALRQDGDAWRVGIRPRSPFFDRLSSGFDLTQDTLVVNEGFAVMTVKPN